MIPVLVSQRVDRVPPHDERRDGLDQRWAGFLAAGGLLAVPVPNDSAVAAALFERVAPAGVVLTGGNDLTALGGTAPERDATEETLLALATARAVPVLGVCRGMQFLLHRFGAALEAVPGHVAVRHPIHPAGGGGAIQVNSYHHFAVRRLAPPLEPLAVAGDGVIEAFRHAVLPVAGIMWHPERESPFRPADVALFHRFLTTGVIGFDP